MDLFELLESEHEQLEGILEQLEETSPTSPQRQELFMKLKQELKPHMKAEEAVFYPALMQHSSCRQDALEATEEHHAAELILNEMDSMSLQDEHWAAKLVVLTDLVQHHVEEEESTIFDDAREFLSEDQLDSIMKQFQQQKKQVASTII